jgi:beta-galactosidase
MFRGPCQVSLSLTAVCAAGLLLSSASAPASAQNVETIEIDASIKDPGPAPARYSPGTAQSPEGDVIGVNSRYLTMNGNSWLPAMGEFHFSRYPASQWDEELLKMKAAGISIVSTYVIWIHHEEVQGKFDWAGQRNLHAFAEACQRHGMLLVVRIGPWAHGEARNGGFPDWIVKAGPTRCNDLYYLAAVSKWYGQIGEQVKGLLWKDGGPIVGIQLENEYAQRGEGAGDAHILMLKKLALESGLDVPLYSVTAWDNAVVPESAVLPLYDGYPDAPWDASLTAWPPAEVYAFRTKSRVAADHPADGTLDQPVPFLTAEMGGGMEDTYHRRPVITPDDIASIVPVMLGSGVNLYGTYMFHGGTNPDGKLATLQESQATGYPTDVPVKSYDFQAPLGEFGQERDSFRKLKVFQYFLRDFGQQLAPMRVYAAVRQPKNPQDLTVLRASVRAAGEQGFLFVNNYTRGAQMPAHGLTQFEIRLPSGTLHLPAGTLSVPSGAYFIWPFNLPIDGMTLRYATAQLFTRIESPTETTLYFEATPGIAPEFAIDASHGRVEQAGKAQVSSEAGTIYIRGIELGLAPAADLVSDRGVRIKLVVLTHEEAENAWKMRLGDTDCLLITRQDFLADGKKIWLRNADAPSFAFTLTPAPQTAPVASLPLTETKPASFTAQAQPVQWDLHYRQTQPPGEVSPVKLGPALAWRPKGVAQAPAGPEFAKAGKWEINIPARSIAGLHELYLKVHYTGDVARLYHAGNLLTDNFYNGQPWTVGLSRFLNFSETNRLDLSILPLRADAPVYLEAPRLPAANTTSGQILNLQSIDLVPEYELAIEIK